MKVTEAYIAFVEPRDGLIAFASVVLDDRLYLSGISVHRKLVGSGYRINYPTRQVGEARFNLIRPTRAIEEAVLGKLKDVLSKVNAGHGRADAGPSAV